MNDDREWWDSLVAATRFTTERIAELLDQCEAFALKVQPPSTGETTNAAC